MGPLCVICGEWSARKSGLCVECLRPYEFGCHPADVGLLVGGLHGLAALFALVDAWRKDEAWNELLAYIEVEPVENGVRVRRLAEPKCPWCVKGFLPTGVMCRTCSGTGVARVPSETEGGR
jgi:hypothetical protein